MKKKKLLLPCVSLYALFLVFAPASQALDVNSSLYAAGEYNDNIFLSETDPRPDRRLIIKPGLNCKLDKASHLFFFDYKSSLLYHDNYPGQDTFRHTFRLSTETDRTKRLSAGLSANDTYRFFYIDPRREDQPVVREDLAEGNQFSVSPFLRLRIGATAAATARYRYNNNHYSIDKYATGAANWRDSESHTASFDWSQELGEVTITIGYDYTEQRFTDPLSEQFNNAREFKSHQANTGLQWNISPSLTASASYGKTWRKYDTGDELSFSNWVAALNFNAELTETTSCTAGYSQFYNEDVYGRTYRSWSGNADLRQQIGRILVLRCGGLYRSLNYKNMNRSSRSWRGNAGLDIDFSDKISLHGDGSIQNWASKETAADNIDRRVYTATASLVYHILEWLELSMRYSYLESTSPVSANREYKVNKYLLAARAAF